MDVLSETLQIRTEMQTVRNNPEPYISPKGIFTNAILTRLPQEVRDNIYAFLWSTHTAEKVNYMALLDPISENSRQNRVPFVPNFVDRGVVGTAFAKEAVRWLYENDQLSMMTMPLPWHDVPVSLRTDVFEVGLAPQDVKIRRLCVELHISGVSEYKILSRRLHNTLEPLLTTQIKLNCHLEIRIAQQIRGSRRDRDQRRLQDVGFSVEITYGLLKQRQNGSYYRVATVPFDVDLLDEDATIGQWRRSITDELREELHSSIDNLRLW